MSGDKLYGQSWNSLAKTAWSRYGVSHVVLESHLELSYAPQSESGCSAASAAVRSKLLRTPLPMSAAGGAVARASASRLRRARTRCRVNQEGGAIYAGPQPRPRLCPVCRHRQWSCLFRRCHCWCFKCSSLAQGNTQARPKRAGFNACVVLIIRGFPKELEHTQVRPCRLASGRL